MRLPFLDRRFMEFALTVPPAEKMSGDVGKLLSRRAMAGLVPDLVLRRLDKGHTSVQARLCCAANRDAILTCVRSPQLETLGIVDAKRLEEAFEEYVAGGNVYFATLHASISLAQWACEHVK
jgi:asparagine synthase (glutamine-hydrolysing)